MARRGAGLPRFLTFGDRVPASLGLLLALMLATSVWGWLDRPAFESIVALSPGLVARGEIWRLVTWPFVQGDPFDLLFGGLMLYWLGQQLAFVWSERRFLVRFVAYSAFATLGATVLALVWEPAAALHYVGVWPVVNALIVSWAMLYPDRQVNIWGVLPITGRMAAWLVVGGTVLWGIARGGVVGLATYTPHLSAILLAWILSRGLGVRPWRDAREWWAERDVRRRARHLKVVKRDGEKDDRPRWLN